MCGHTALQQTSKHWFTKAFLGVSGLTEQGGFDSSTEDTQVKRVYIERLDEVILLCDSSKFGKRSLAHASRLEAIDMVTSDAEPPAALLAALMAAGVELRIAQE